ARQVEALEAIVRSNPVACSLLDQLPGFDLPSWYLGAGGVAQTVWNHLHGFAPTHGVTDYDIVYFDPDDLTEAGEKAIEARVASVAGAGGAKIDLTNEARVHTWYERRFGRPLAAYRSTEHAIATWPTTATSLGVRYDGSDFVVCAPFGLADLFSMVVRPNTTLVDRGVYEAKAERWRRLWPRLTVAPWS
ncbi:MAG: nucleotidyltransferase family protein, partial [Acidimicrobiales bacterium]